MKFPYVVKKKQIELDDMAKSKYSLSEAQIAKRIKEGSGSMKFHL
jgi:hypothetical protein